MAVGSSDGAARDGPLALAFPPASRSNCVIPAVDARPVRLTVPPGPLDEAFVRAAGHAARKLAAPVHDALVDFADAPGPAAVLMLRRVPIGRIPAHAARTRRATRGRASTASSRSSPLPGASASRSATSRSTAAGSCRTSCRLEPPSPGSSPRRRRSRSSGTRRPRSTRTNRGTSCWSACGATRTLARCSVRLPRSCRISTT